jgi:hypothetical protein
MPCPESGLRAISRLGRRANRSPRQTRLPRQNPFLQDLRHASICGGFRGFRRPLGTPPWPGHRYSQPNGPIPARTVSRGLQSTHGIHPRVPASQEHQVDIEAPRYGEVKWLSVTPFSPAVRHTDFEVSGAVQARPPLPGAGCTAGTVERQTDLDTTRYESG